MGVSAAGRRLIRGGVGGGWVGGAGGRAGRVGAGRRAGAAVGGGRGGRDLVGGAVEIENSLLMKAPGWLEEGCRECSKHAVRPQS